MLRLRARLDVRLVIVVAGAAAACGGDRATTSDGPLDPIDGAIADAALDAPALDAPALDAPADAPALDAAIAGGVRWSHVFGGIAFETLSALAPTTDGGVVVAGYTNGAVDLGGGPIGDGSNRSLLVARYGADGTHRWSRGFVISGSLSDPAPPVSLAIGPAGDVYLATDTTTSTLDVGTGPLPHIGVRDALLVRFSSAGAPLSARRLGGVGASVAIRDVAIDDAGEVFAAGTFNVTLSSTPPSTIDLGNGPIGGAGTNNAWVAKLEATLATTTWSRRLGAPIYPDGNSATAIAIEPATQDAIVCGTFTRTTDLGGGPRQAAGGGVGVPDLFLLALHGDGSYAADMTMGGSASETCNRLRIDAGGRRYLAGTFNTATTLGGVTRAAIGFSDGYGLSLEGATATYLVTAGSANHVVAATGLTPGGGIAGTFTGAIDVGGVPLSTTSFSSGFVARLGATGAAVWGHAIGDSGTGGVEAVTETADTIIVAGRFEGQVTLDGTPRGSVGFSDIFLAAYNR